MAVVINKLLIGFWIFLVFEILEKACWKPFILNFLEIFTFHFSSSKPKFEPFSLEFETEILVMSSWDLKSSILP
jgi:hypothetical protein